MDFLKDSKQVNPPIPVLDEKIPISSYCRLDLSTSNVDLDRIRLSDPEVCQHYIDDVLNEENAQVAYGGYLEERNLYTSSERFGGKAPRNIHLGIDFWCKAGTKVIAPLNGTVHSFANNSDYGNYGPTIILVHEINGTIFHSLYGHLALSSLDTPYIGKNITKGDVLGTLGTPDCNVGYAPHLHFQLIYDMGDCQGDYPGVCSKVDIDFFRKNCPDPNIVLGFEWWVSVKCHMDSISGFGGDFPSSNIFCSLTLIRFLNEKFVAHSDINLARWQTKIALG